MNDGNCGAIDIPVVPPNMGMQMLNFLSKMADENLMRMTKFYEVPICTIPRQARAICLWLSFSREHGRSAASLHEFKMGESPHPQNALEECSKFVQINWAIFVNRWPIHRYKAWSARRGHSLKSKL
jgi:hypothetical protein